MVATDESLSFMRNLEAVENPRSSLARSLYRSSSQSSDALPMAMSRDRDLEAFLADERGGGGGDMHDGGCDDDMGACLPKRHEWDKQDGRLHYDYPLYCEGMPKPTCRGIFHMICCIILPYPLWILIQESNGNTTAIMASVLYMLSNMWCYGASGIYHVGRWSAKTEILLQKLDHAGIAIMSVGTFLPTIFLLFPPVEGFLFLSLLAGTCAKNIHGIFNLDPSLIGQVLVPATSVLFLYRLWEVFTPLELSLYGITIVLKMCGVMVFVRRKPDPFPSTFGYHEIFHCFVIAAGCTIFTCNYSIIHRICNPYAHSIDVVSDSFMEAMEGIQAIEK